MKMTLLGDSVEDVDVESLEGCGAVGLTGGIIEVVVVIPARGSFSACEDNCVASLD